MKKITVCALLGLVLSCTLSLMACATGGPDQPGEDGIDEENVAAAQQAVLANWQPCTSDGACASNWCGCNGATERVCLPSTAYPKYCGNWTSCWTDAQCVSNWCGCNGTGNVMWCLPSTASPKGCSL